MSKIEFRQNAFRTAARKQLLEKVLKVVDSHVAAGIQRVTARQLYYRLVAANVVPNTEKSYKSVTALLADARYAGRIDRDFIVDLGREPIIPQQFNDLRHLARTALRALRYDRWQGQNHYVELWVEKQALQSVLEPIGDEFHVPVVVNKGYTSASSMFRNAARLIHAQKNLARTPVVIYCGDFDPSGEDMVRDVEERLNEFGAHPIVSKLALTLPQVFENECPPNPAKITDSRCAAYVERMRDDDVYASICDAQGLDVDEGYSWELDALPVDVFETLVREAIQDWIKYPKAVKEVIAREKRDKERLERAVEEIMEETEDD